MSYLIGKYDTMSAEEYAAARRDVKKIESLKKRGGSASKIAGEQLAEIRERRMTFETHIGKDFIDRLEQQTGKPVSEQVRAAAEREAGEADTKAAETKAAATKAAGSKAKKSGGQLTAQGYRVSGSKKAAKQIMLMPLVFFFVVVGILLFLWVRLEYNSLSNLEDVQRQARLAADAEAEAAEGERVILPQLAALYEQNSDLAGWLTIPGTNVDYPIMYRADDNDFYLTHDFNGEEDINGLLVLDKRCDPQGDGVNSLIHGHNMNSGAMFGSLKYYESEGYMREHPTIEYSTLYETRTYEILAVFKSTVYDEETSDFQYFNYIEINDESRFNEYVESARQQSLYDTGVEAAWGDRLITLSTCEYSRENGRLVIVGRQRADE